MRALSTRNDDPERASRPYDQDRDGFVLSEGGAMLILEDYEFAKARGARIYCEIIGYGVSSDAHHITAPSMEGPARAMKLALKDAKLNSEDLDYVNAHGTSTPAGDLNELRALKLALGEDTAKQISISSTKSMTGHLLGSCSGNRGSFLYQSHGARPLYLYDQYRKSGLRNVIWTSLQTWLVNVRYACHVKRLRLRWGRMPRSSSVKSNPILSS